MLDQRNAAVRLTLLGQELVEALNEHRFDDALVLSRTLDEAAASLHADMERAAPVARPA